MNTKKLWILAAFAVASVPSFAQTSNYSKLLYGELGYTEMDLKLSGAPGYSSDNETLSAILGYKFHPNVSGEVFLADGISSSDIGNSYGLFVKPNMMLTDKVELFGRLGYVSTKVEVSRGGVSVSDRDSSFAYGAGFNYLFTDSFYGQFAYTSFYDKDNDRVKGYTVGVGMRF